MASIRRKGSQLRQNRTQPKPAEPPKPFKRRRPSQPIRPIGPQVPESLDLSKPADQALVEQAIKKRWPTCETHRIAIVREMARIIRDGRYDDKARIGAARIYLGIERQNQIDEIAAQVGTRAAGAGTTVNVNIDNRIGVLERLAETIRNQPILVADLCGAPGVATGDVAGLAGDGSVAGSLATVSTSSGDRSGNHANGSSPNGKNGHSAH